MKTRSKETPTLGFTANDSRSNSGLREGDIPHAEVNAELRRLPKTVIFGQQTRLRNGVLMEDEKLPRFHAGHGLVKFFYQGLRKLPEFLLDALLENNVSVTLVTGRDLLVFHDVRNHQSFHVGHTRKTIYMPEGVLREAIDKGYDSWAVSEALIREAWPLLDYLLILSFVRHAQMHFRTRFSLGSPGVVKNLLRLRNRHLKEAEGAQDTDFTAFYRHYCNDLFGLRRDIVGQDPYGIADRIFDERQERAWAEIKLNEITTTFDYPTYFDLDRDIVHQAAFGAASARGLPTEPQTTGDLLHDLKDAARFKVLRQTRTDRLLDQLLERGAPGIAGFAGVIAEEYATGLPFVTAQYGGYDAVAEFKGKLLALSNTPPEGGIDSICNDFRDLLRYAISRHMHALIQKFAALPPREQREDIAYLKNLLQKIIGTANLADPTAQASLAATVAGTRSVQTLLSTGERLVGPETPHVKRDLLLTMLRKMDRHPGYHTTLLAQVRELAGDERLSLGENIRDQVDALHALIPPHPYRKSSDPQGLRACLHQYEIIRKRTPDSRMLFPLLTGVLVRLDLAGDYAGIVEQVRLIGEAAKPPLQEVLEKMDPHDEGRRAIRQAAQDLLGSL